MGNNLAALAVGKDRAVVKVNVRAEVEFVAQAIFRDLPAAGNGWRGLKLVVKLDEAVVKLGSGPDVGLVAGKSWI